LKHNGFDDNSHANVVIRTIYYRNGQLFKNYRFRKIIPRFYSM